MNWKNIKRIYTVIFTFFIQFIEYTCFNIGMFLDLVVAYKKLSIEKNILEETLKASSNYDKDDVSETDNSEVL